jgi:peptide/nickel transport system substrate-binding protein
MDRRRFLRAAAAGTLAGAGLPLPALAESPRRGGTLKCIGLEPASYDMHASPAEDTALASSLVRRTLFKLTTGSRPGFSDSVVVPDLALKADMSRDGRIYTIALRPGVRWEDKAPVRGRELVAADVKYSLERALRRSAHASLLGPIEAVEAQSRHLVRVHLADTFTPFLSNLAEPWMAVLPREVEDRAGDFKSADGLIGCGPFALERYEPGVKAVFTRNPGYHVKGLPYLDQVEWLFIKERATQLSLFRAGQVELPFHDARIARAEAAELRRSNPGYPIAYWDGLAVRRLALRSDRAPLSDVRVRRALSLAVDRKRWVAEHLDGHGVEDPGPVPAGMRQWKLAGRALGDGARWLTHDPALARRLLAEAGVTGGMRMRCALGPGGSAESAADLERLAACLREIGVELQLVGEEPGRMDDASWRSTEPFTEVDGHLYAAYRSGHPGNRSLVSDPRLDALLEAQRRATGRRDRKGLIDDIQRRAADQVHYLFPPAPRQVSSWAPWVRQYQPRGSLDRGAQLESVWLSRRP